MEAGSAGRGAQDPGGCNGQLASINSSPTGDDSWLLDQTAEFVSDEEIDENLGRNEPDEV